GLEQLAPIEAALDAEYLALAERLLATGRTDGVAGFLAEQVFVAADHIDRCERALQVFAELGGGQFHGGKTGAARAPGSSLIRQFDRRLLRLRVEHPLLGLERFGLGARLGFGGGLQRVELSLTDALDAH